MKKYRIIQQRERCIGCNACFEAAPDRWRMSRADGKSTLVASIQKKGYHMVVIDQSELADNQIAMKNCPVNIISIKEIDKIGG